MSIMNSIHQATILVVDDDQDTLELLIEFLDIAGYHALPARGGDVALSILNNASPDLILLDVMMSEMNGFEICHRLKQNSETKDIPVIFITALNEAENKVKGFEAGGIDYITKPFQQQEVLARITAHLANRRLQKQLERERSWFQDLSDATFEGIVIHNEGDIVEINQSIESFFGYDHDELIEKNLLDLIAPEYQEIASTNILKDETKLPYMIKGLKKSGQRFLLESQTKIIQWQGQSLHVTAMRDITLRKELEHENRTLRTTLKDRYKFGEMIGKSPAMQNVYEFLTRAAATDQNVAIYGESGTGKELAARMIHQLSDRREQPFVPVNCGAIPDNLFESQFFGHYKGAFTGAEYTAAGYFEQAQRGTLFLDEVGELSPAMQAKLLRVLNDKVYTPIGSRSRHVADVRIIAATNQDLLGQMSSGGIRRDFFHRIHVLTVKLPPLREHPEDIPLLIEHFLDQQEGNYKGRVIPASILEEFFPYDWPGNIRELFNELTRYLTTGQLEMADGVPSTQFSEMEPLPFLQDDLPLSKAMETFEKFYISRILQKNSGRKGKAAIELQVDRKTLYKKLKKYGDD